MAERTPRAQSTREDEQRQKTWKPATLLPTPDPRNGLEFRWVRSSAGGRPDNLNVSSKMREGWTPVPASEFPELKVLSDHDSRFPDNIEVGGLILCQIDASLMQQKRDYYSKKAMQQIESVDRNFMRENDSRMPLLPPERKTRTTNFG